MTTEAVTPSSARPEHGPSHIEARERLQAEVAAIPDDVSADTLWLIALDARDWRTLLDTPTRGLDATDVFEALVTASSHETDDASLVGGRISFSGDFDPQAFLAALLSSQTPVAVKVPGMQNNTSATPTQEGVGREEIARIIGKHVKIGWSRVLSTYDLLGIEEAAAEIAASASLRPRDIGTAPRNDTMVRLLVAYDDRKAHASPLNDEAWDRPEGDWTIGFNGYDLHGDDEWIILGYDMDRETFVNGRGRILGWLPYEAALSSLLPASKLGEDPGWLDRVFTEYPLPNAMKVSFDREGSDINFTLWNEAGDPVCCHTLAQPAPGAPEGWALVPAEPTDQQLDLGQDAIQNYGAGHCGVGDIYLAMLSPYRPALTSSSAKPGGGGFDTRLATLIVQALKDAGVYDEDAAQHVSNEVQAYVAQSNRRLWEGLDLPISWELSWGEVSDEEGAACGWRVHERSGNRSDREWTLLATADTPMEALIQARAALKDNGHG